MNSTTNTLISQIRQIPVSKIKEIINRRRLCFTWVELEFYLKFLAQQQAEPKWFKAIYHEQVEGGYNLSYSNFMKNLLVIAPLWEVMFKLSLIKYRIKPSRLLNIVDTTLLKEKEEYCLRPEDFRKRVTLRKNHPICGSKALVILNRTKQIVTVKLLEIYESDFNLLKSASFRTLNLTQGILLADRGFNSKMVRNELAHSEVKLISPPHGKEKWRLSAQERRIYRYRWQIETVFSKTQARIRYF